MAYAIFLHPKAVKGLRSIHHKEAARVKRALRALEEDPFSPRSGADIQKLRGTQGRHDLYRLRIGRFSVIYAVIGKEVQVSNLFERGAGYEV